MITIVKGEYSAEIRELLLLADPSEDVIENYIHESDIWICSSEYSVVGVIAVKKVNEKLYEIMNVAVHPAHQRKGIGRMLLKHVLEVISGGNTLRVCTGNSSTHQLKLYQQVGFELVQVNWNYFKRHYSEPIFEDGIRCLHQMVLEIRK